MAGEVQNCGICLNSLKDRIYLPLVKRNEACRHMFHFQCLKKWTQTCGSSSLDHGHPTCPCCRRKILGIYPLSKGSFYKVKYREYLNESGKIVVDFEIKRIGMCEGLDEKFKPISHAITSRSKVRQSMDVQTPEIFYNINDLIMDEEILIQNFGPGPGQDSEDANVESVPNIEPGPVSDIAEAGLVDQAEAGSSDSETVHVAPRPDSAQEAEAAHNECQQNPVTLGLILAAILVVVAIMTMGYTFK